MTPRVVFCSPCRRCHPQSLLRRTMARPDRSCSRSQQPGMLPRAISPRITISYVPPAASKQTVLAPCICRRADTGRPTQQMQIDSSGNARMAGGRSPQLRISVQAPPPPPPHFARCTCSSGVGIFQEFGSCMHMLPWGMLRVNAVLVPPCNAEHRELVAPQSHLAAPGLSRR
jgi:hypothetical protein